MDSGLMTEEKEEEIELTAPLEFKILEDCDQELHEICPRIFEEFQCGCECHFGGIQEADDETEEEDEEDI